MPGARCLWRAGVLVAMGCGMLCAQEEKPAFTLHAYADLIQVPALVLDAALQPPRHPVDTGKFAISLDSGAKFSPTNVKVEGDDPLALTIVLEMSGSQKKLVEGLPAAIAEFATSALHPQDHLSIYLLECGQLLKLNDRIVSDSKGVQRALSDAAESRKELNDAACADRILLWSALVGVVRDLDKSAGRRSMLVVSDGVDNGSRISWSDLHSVAGLHGVALFGMNDGAVDMMRAMKELPDRLYALCESTGGIVLQTSPAKSGEALARWVSLLRGRYVIEFPRPQQMGSGVHSIVVSLKGSPSAFVTVAGVPVSVPDASQIADPSRVHSDAGADIPMGKRRPLLDKR